MIPEKTIPVFIVGMNGSGTTMLLDCLNHHPTIHGFRKESRIIPYYMDSIHKYRDLNKNRNFLRLFNDVRNELVFKIVNQGKAPPLPDNWKELPRTLATVLDSIFKYFAQKDGKSRWCDKTPGYAKHISRIHQLFPESKFIHIIRDGRDCAASLNRRWGYVPEAMIYRWKHLVKEGRRQGNLLGPHHYLEIHYEELTRTPIKWMKEICQFLNVDYVESIMEPSRLRNYTGSKSKELISSEQKWRTYFNKNQLRNLEIIAGKQLNESGYDTKFYYSDFNPSPSRLSYWTYYGYIYERFRSMTERFRNGESFWFQLQSTLNRVKTMYKIT
jgi:hypothetical protein